MRVEDCVGDWFLARGVVVVWRGLVVVVVVVVARLCELLKDSSDRVSPRGRTALKRAPGRRFLKSEVGALSFFCFMEI